jgi:RNA polymerase sigma-70 factor (ECF subfamily)
VQYDVANFALKRYVDAADEQAFRELVSLYQPMVFAVCRRVLGTAADAEDATSETFIKLSRHASTIRGSIGSWLYTCALNVARDQRHAMLARRAREREFSERREPPAEPSFDADEYSLLNRCMAELGDQDRDVIALYYFLGLTQEQIAGRYGITQVGVKRRLDRAIRALRFNLVRAGFDLSTAATGRPCGVTTEGEIDLVSLGAVLLAAVLAGPSLAQQAGQASQCSAALAWGDGLGRRGLVVAGSLMQTTEPMLSGRQRDRYRFGKPSWPLRALGWLQDAADLTRDAVAIRVAALRHR